MRKSNLELLRIMAMLLIICGHFVGQALSIDSISIGNYIAIAFFSSGSRIAVNIFLLISLWFLVDDCSRQYYRIIKLFYQLWSYSIILSILSFIFWGAKISLKNILHSCFPFITNSLWFVSVYIVLLLISPFLNSFWAIDKHKQKTILVILLAVCCIRPSLQPFADTGLNGIAWFSFLYLFVGYWKHNYNPTFNKNIIFATGTFVYIVLVACEIFGPQNGIVNNMAIQWLSDYKSAPNFFVSLCIFYFFLNLNISNSSIVNSIGKGTLGIYIFHQTYVFYPCLWKLFVTPMWEDDIYYVPKFLFSVSCVFFVGSIIDYFKRSTIDKVFFKSHTYHLLESILQSCYEEK